MRRGLTWLILLSLGLACRPSGSAEDGETGDLEPEDEYEPPVFVDPASGELLLEHDQLEDIALRVTGLEPGRTHLHIDGESVGTLLQPTPSGEFVGETLRLRLDGAMVKGTHKLQLVTLGTIAQQGSVAVDVRILPGPKPTLDYELGSKVVADGEHLTASGTAERGLLSIVEVTGATQATVHLLRAKQSGWDPDDVRSVELPGYVHDEDDPRAAAAAAVVAVDEETGGRVRIAWRVGRPGRRIDVREFDWDDDDDGQVATGIDAQGLPGFEWSSVGLPRIVGPHVMAEAYLASDTETPLPGDEAVLVARWPLGDDTPKAWNRLHFGQLMDIDLLGPAVDLSRTADDRVALRLDGISPVLAEWSATGVAPSLADPGVATGSPQLGSEPSSIAAVFGAFGSRSVAAAYPSGALRVQLIDASGARAARKANPPGAEVPDEPPTGPIAPTVAAGTPIFLVPYGVATSVRALVIDGDKTAVQMLDDLLCEEVAVPASAAVNEAGSMSFACLQDGEVRLGALFASGD